MGKLRVRLAAGILLGGALLLLGWLLDTVWQVGKLEDNLFFLGIAALVVGLFALIRVSRVYTAGTAMSPGNVNAQTAFAMEVAFEEERMLRRAGRRAARYATSGALPFLLAAVICFAGFGVSLLF